MSVNREKTSSDDINKSVSIKADIDKIEEDLKESHAIERLNMNAATVKERALIYDQLKALDQLRAREIEQDFIKIEQEIGQLELKIPSWLTPYQVGP